MQCNRTKEAFLISKRQVAFSPISSFEFYFIYFISRVLQKKFFLEAKFKLFLLRLDCKSFCVLHLICLTPRSRIFFPNSFTIYFLSTYVEVIWKSLPWCGFRLEQIHITLVASKKYSLKKWSKGTQKSHYYLYQVSWPKFLTHSAYLTSKRRWTRFLT